MRRVQGASLIRFATFREMLEHQHSRKLIAFDAFGSFVQGGLLVLDDYGTVYGETKAVDEFLKKKGLALRLEKLPFYKIPVFLVKE